MSHERPNVMVRDYNNRMLVMYRPNLCENLLYPFLRFCNSGGDIPAPILNILATILKIQSVASEVGGLKKLKELAMALEG